MNYTMKNKNTPTPSWQWASLAAVTLALSGCGGGAGSTFATATAPNIDITKASAFTSVDAGTLAAKTAQTAFDAEGNAIAVWAQPNGAYSEIWFDRFTAANGWSGAALLARGNGDAQHPQLTVDASGNTWVVWQQFDGATHNIWANRFTAAGNAWGTATLIENYIGGAVNTADESMPQIAADGSGNVFVVWQRLDSQRSSIWASRFDAAANSWGTGAPIEVSTAGSAFDPQVLMDFNGQAVAAWSRRDGAPNDIWTSRYLVGMGWAAPVQLKAVT